MNNQIVLEKFDKTINQMKLPRIYLEIAEKVLVRDPIRTKYVYGVSETKDNAPAVLEAIRKYDANSVILMPESARGLAGSAGFGFYEGWLGANGKDVTKIPQRNPEMFDAYPERFNTYSEIQALVDYLNEKGLPEITIVAPEFHQIRAFWGLVSSIKEEGVNIKGYNYMGEPQPWDEIVKHSQGKVIEKRENLITSELERIVRYQESNLVSPEEVLEYINNRD